MLQVVVTAPSFCQPCNGDTLEISLGLQTYYVTAPMNIFAGETFTALLPASAAAPPPPVVVVPAQPARPARPVPAAPVVVVPAQPARPAPRPPRRPVVAPPPIEPPPVDVAAIAQDGNMYTFEVTVPAPKRAGQNMQIKFPEGRVALVGIPAGFNAGDRFNFTTSYDPTAEIIAVIERSNRCCCSGSETAAECFWVPWFLNKKGHCPRFQYVQGADQGVCARRHCWAGIKNCVKSHYRPGRCAPERGPSPAYVGKKCAKTLL